MHDHRDDAAASRYLDHAATSFPKPAVVHETVLDWYRRLGVSADRGDGPATAEVADRVAGCRAQAAALFGVRPEHLLFTSGATEALNLALRALLPSPGRRVLTTDLEHNAVARSLHALGAEIVRVPADPEGRLDAHRIVEELERDSDYALLACCHGSNVTGTVVDGLDEICRLARTRGVATVVDACQTAGAVRCDAIDADLVAASAHKSLLGPPGLGLLAVRADFAERMPVQRFGGTGSATNSATQPDHWPGGHEPGTPNTPAILGLAAALAWRHEQGAEALHTRCLNALDALVPPLERAGLRVLRSPESASLRLPVLAVVPHADDMHDPTELGMLLGECGITVRTGHCCAPWIHERLGTVETGVLRLSTGPFVDPAIAAAALERALGG